MIEARMNPQKLIENGMPALIEAFVTFYGEDKREKIEKKFKDLVVVGYLSKGTFTSYLGDLKRECASEAMSYFTKKTGINSKKQLTALFGNELNLNINSITAFNREYNSGNYENALAYIREFIGDYTLTYDDELVKDAVKVFIELKPIVDETLSKYNSLMDQKVKKYDDYMQTINNQERVIEDQNDHEFLLELEAKGLLDEHDREIIHGEKRYDNTMLNCRAILSGCNRVLSTGYLESFDEECDEILLDNDIFKDTKKSIIKDRIAYFKKMGIDLGDNYDAYVNSEECKKIWPSKELIEEIKELKIFYTRKAISECVEHMPHLAIQKKKLDSIPFICDCCFAETILSDNTCIGTNYVYEGDRVVQKPLLYFSASNPIETFDCQLVHELNHLYELVLIGVENDKAMSACGWDIVPEGLNTIDVDIYDSDGIKERRNFEMFSEIINEYIAQDITTAMHNKGIFILGNAEVSKNSSNSTYESYLGPFVRKFYTEFKEEIIASRECRDMSKLFDVIGEENFIEFNDMLRDYSKRAERIGVERLQKAINSGANNSDTRAYFDCLEKSDELMERFRESKKQYLQREGKSI